MSRILGDKCRHSWNSSFYSFDSIMLSYTGIGMQHKGLNDHSNDYLEIKFVRMSY
jgi:hypothetical protein